MLRSRIRGSLFGVLLGDCNGALFEGESFAEAGARIVLANHFNRLEEDVLKGPQKMYTDDTAMSIALARTLIEKKSIDQNLLATNLVEEYCKNKRRNYGKGAVAILEKWQKTNFADILEPAKKLFNGSGSTGNGAAMRIAPLALFCHNRTTKDLLNMAKQSAEVTHANNLAIIGCALQALAIHQTLKLAAEDSPIVAATFLESLETDLKTIECDQTDDIEIYCYRIGQIKRLLNIDPSDEQVINVLGNNCHAIDSVPTAIYCFLRCFQPINGIKTTNQFRKSIEFSIRLGGDTDTIASMTAALSGAYLGEDEIEEKFIKNCEGHEIIGKLADVLYTSSLES